MAEQRVADDGHVQQFPELVVGDEAAVAHVRVAGGHRRVTVCGDGEAEDHDVRIGRGIERFGDVGQRADAHLEPGLFAQFARHRHRDGLVALLAPARQIPQQSRVVGILIADHEHATIALEQSGADVHARHHAEFDVRARIARRRMDVEVFGVTDAARMEEALAIRFAVFVAEQAVPEDEEIDDHDRSDPHARHALVRDASGGRAGIAAGRYYRRDARTAQIGRMAVAAAQRGRGAGRALLDALLADARANGYVRASLNAQVHAAAFYEKAGFAPVGPTFHECEILHQAMERDL